MKKWGLSAAIGAVLLMGMVAWTQVRGSRVTTVQSPAVTFPEQVVDFGVVLPGRLVSTEFAFTNSGGGVLQLSNITTSCGCTAAKLDRTSFQPGESGAIKVSFQLPLTSDPVTHSVAVATNDPQRPVAQLVVKADPEWPIAANPEALHLVPVVKGRPTEAVVELYTPSGKPFEVLNAKPSTDWISIQAMRESGRRHAYRIGLNPTQSGRFKEQVVFQTDVAERETLTVPIAGEVILPARVVPSRLLLGMQTGGSDITRKLVLTYCDSDTKIDNIRASKEDWQILGWETKRDGEQVTIDVQIRIPTNDGYHRGSIVVTLGSSTDQLRIPISCVVASKDNIVTEQPGPFLPP